MKISELMRMSHVKRWGIVDTSRPQTIAEHSFNVTILATRLVHDIGWNGVLHPDRHLQVVYWALMHDSIEVFTGDTPTPYKETLRGCGADIVKAEASYDRNYYEVAGVMRGTVGEMVVKLADLIEAIHFLDNYGVGRHAREEVLPLLRGQLTELVDRCSDANPTLHIRKAVRAMCEELGI